MKSVFITLGLASLALAAPSKLASRQETAEQATDRLLFSSTMEEFQAARNAQNPSNLDWSSNGCTASPDNPFGFNFLQSCHRHDFGYRNYQAQNRFSDPNKLRIDDNFKVDMDAQCETEGGEFEVNACKGVATVYYEAVKAFGSKRSAEFLEKREAARKMAEEK